MGKTYVEDVRELNLQKGMKTWKMSNSMISFFVFYTLFKSLEIFLEQQELVEFFCIALGNICGDSVLVVAFFFN